MLATPVSEYDGNNYPIPRIRNITTTGFEMSVCVDTGQSTCSSTSSTHDIHYVLVDTKAAELYAWIDVGKVSANTNGSSTPFSFSSYSAFTASPYVRTTPQTSRQ